MSEEEHHTLRLGFDLPLLALPELR